jgi:hypothetical protein
MANKIYKDHLIVSRPRYDEIEKTWFAYVTISWRGNGHLHIHSLDPPKAFEAKEDATVEGFRLADLWVDHRL